MNLDTLRWGAIAVAMVAFLAWRHTTTASETTKRLALMAWLIFWTVVPLVLGGLVADPITILLVILLITAGAMLRGTQFAPYFAVAMFAFIGAMVLIFVVQAALHPNACCPSPMYVDAQGICQR